MIQISVRDNKIITHLLDDDYSCVLPSENSLLLNDQNYGRRWKSNASIALNVIYFTDTGLSMNGIKDVTLLYLYGLFFFRLTNQ